MSETRPGRYSRSASGLVASMAVVVLAVVALVAFRSLVSRDPDVSPTRIDYLQTVSDLQDSGFFPVYPASLAAGWAATNVDFTPGIPPRFGLSFLTDQQHYVGIQESSQDVGVLLDTYVDSDTTAEPDLATPGGLAPTWLGWSDQGGDHAFSTQVGGQSVLVFGSAPVADLEDLVRRLTQDPQSAGVSPTPSPSPTQG